VFAITALFALDSGDKSAHRRMKTMVAAKKISKEKSKQAEPHFN
jgi:hypothetical protein